MNFKRREFIRLGGITVAGTMIAPSILHSCKSAPVSQTAAGYMDHFEVDPGILQKVIAAAMEKGADYADLFFEHSLNNRSTLEDGKVNSAYSNVSFGVGIRVLKGDQTGFAYSETVTPEAMLKAAKTAANIADSKSAAGPVRIDEFTPPNLYPVVNSWENTSINNKIPYLTRLNEQIFAGDKRVTKVNAYLLDTTTYMLFYSSEGRMAWDYRPMGTLIGVCIMEDKGRIENGNVSRSFRTGFELMTNDLIDQISDEVVKRTAMLFEATKPKAGEMEVILAAGESGILLHEAMGHSFEADFNRKNTSIFSDKLGKEIARNFVTIVDDGTIAGNRGAINVDDEGNPTEKTVLVSNGVLTSYLHDRISASYYKVKPTGNGRRQDFRNIPIPRMRSTYMENGPHKKEEIVASTKSGIYVDNFSNGQVNIGPGDFTFFVKFGYLIENGKLTRPIKDVNIIGNGPQALADITMVADDKKMTNGSWTCGKDGQSAPVTMGIPTVKVKKLTVGGMNS
jgi:TldD protein